MTALGTYTKIQIEINQCLDNIKKLAERHQDLHKPEEITWASVGDLQHIVEELRLIEEFLSQ